MYTNTMILINKQEIKCEKHGVLSVPAPRRTVAEVSEAEPHRGAPVSICSHLRCTPSGVLLTADVLPWLTLCHLRSRNLLTPLSADASIPQYVRRFWEMGDDRPQTSWGPCCDMCEHHPLVSLPPNSSEKINIWAEKGFSKCEEKTGNAEKTRNCWEPNCKAFEALRVRKVQVQTPPLDGERQKFTMGKGVVVKCCDSRGQLYNQSATTDDHVHIQSYLNDGEFRALLNFICLKYTSLLFL